MSALLAHALGCHRELRRHAGNILALQRRLAHDLLDPAHGAGDLFAGCLLLLRRCRDRLDPGHHVLDNAAGLVGQRGAEVRFLGCLLG
ncbi:MAG: hypothetical protein C4289_09920, partial [Chloroflexota bacterium]